MPTSKHITQKAKHNITGGGGGGFGSFVRKISSKLTFKKTPKSKQTNTRAYNDFTVISHNDREYKNLELQIKKLTDENEKLNTDKSNDKTHIANIQQECDKKLKEKDNEILRQTEFGQEAFNRKEHYKKMYNACVAGGATISKEKADLNIKIKQLEDKLKFANEQLKLCGKTESMDLKQISDLREKQSYLEGLIKQLETNGKLSESSTYQLIMQNLENVDKLFKKQEREQKLNANIIALLLYANAYDTHVRDYLKQILMLLNENNNNLNIEQDLFNKLMGLISKLGESPKPPNIL